MTHTQIEQRAEVRRNQLDKRYLRGEVTEGEYEAEVHALEETERRQVERAKRRRH